MPESGIIVFINKLFTMVPSVVFASIQSMFQIDRIDVLF